MPESQEQAIVFIVIGALILGIVVLGIVLLVRIEIWLWKKRKLWELMEENNAAEAVMIETIYSPSGENGEVYIIGNVQVILWMKRKVHQYMTR